MTSFLLQIGSSFVAALFLVVICLRALMRHRLTWRTLPLGRQIAAILRRSPLLVQNGPWRMDLSVGSKKAGLYTRAFTARNRRFALSAPETVYFAASADSSGRKLDGGSTYCLEAKDPDARWWSLTVYKQDHLIPNPLNRYSLSKTTVARRPDGSWKVILSPRQQAENWLPSGEPAGELVLILRFYGPGSELLTNPGKIQLPEILEVASQ